ncbi:MAG: 3-hydroxyacyl-CoA dehydrogenase NAD-binding domain-containing protein, partial [Sphingomonadales bacterium]
LFANAGWGVALYDHAEGAACEAVKAISRNAALLETEGMIASRDALMERLTIAASLEEVTDSALYVQESVTENAAVKQSVFNELGRITGEDVILASSCSTIPPQAFLEEARHPERCIIAHPFSPPHLIPLVEIVLTRHTSAAVATRTRTLMQEIGQKPVLIRKPVVGFAVNRLQAVVINEALHLVREGVISPQDLDICMSQGLGLRWAFMGPFETMELNAPNGFRDYVTRYGEIYRAILDDVDIETPWRGQAVDLVEAWRRRDYPGADDVTERRLWRDHNLMKLARLFRGPQLGSGVS